MRILLYSNDLLAIALPNQKISSNRDHDEPSTHRRHTFSDLISHLKHYNAGARKGLFYSTEKPDRLLIGYYG